MSDEEYKSGIWIALVGVAIGGVLFVGVLLLTRGSVGEDEPLMQFVSGTEYNIGEAGQVIVEARFANGTNAIVSPCNVSIWYPDKTLFLLNQTVTATSGNEFIDFTVPNTTGIFEYQSICGLTTGKTGTISKSFHVSEFQNETAVKLNRIRAVMAK